MPDETRFDTVQTKLSGRRIFTRKDDLGRYHHPRTGRIMTRADAVKLNARARRDLLVTGIAQATGDTKKAVRQKLKGISYNDLTGRKRKGKQSKRAKSVLGRMGVANVGAILRY